MKYEGWIKKKRKKVWGRSIQREWFLELSFLPQFLSSCSDLKFSSICLDLEEKLVAKP